MDGVHFNRLRDIVFWGVVWIINSITFATARILHENFFVGLFLSVLTFVMFAYTAYFKPLEYKTGDEA